MSFGHWYILVGAICFAVTDHLSFAVGLLICGYIMGVFIG